MNKKRIALLLMLVSLLTTGMLTAQESPGFREYDRTTWRLYQEKQWDSLIVVGKKALADGNDYQYLNARLGVAWFEKGNYRMASYYFGKALRMNEGDEFSREYLYFSHLYSGRSGSARAISKGFSESTRERLNLPASVGPDFVYAEMGPVKANAINPLRDVLISGTDSIYGEFNLPGNAFYFHAGGSFALGPYITAYAGYSNLSLDRYQRIQTGTFDTVKRSYDFNQHQAYFNFSVEPVPGLRIVPSFHYIYNMSRLVTATYNTDSAKYYFTLNPIKNNQVATGLALYVDWKTFTLTLHGNYAHLMGLDQAGGGIALTWYPAGNLNYWLRMHATFLSEEGTGRWITEPQAGMRITSHLWAEATVAFGDMTRYVDETNFVIYNTDDKTTLRAQGVIYIPAFDNVMFSVRYIFNKAEGTVWHYDLTSASMMAEKTNYEKHTILGGIKWNF